MKSLARIFALVIRYFYLIKTSFPRILELMYWPTFQMILWGLIAKYIASSNDTIIQIGGVLIAGVLLWDVLLNWLSCSLETECVSCAFLKSISECGCASFLVC